MPAESKLRWAKLRVGIMALTAMVILAVLVFLITGNTNIFASQATLYTYMADAVTLTRGAPVYLNGIPIGKVSDIRLSGLTDPAKIVKLTMEVDRDKLAAIPVDSQTSISAANVLGTKFINIKKGISATHVQDHDTVPGLNTAEFEDVVQQGYAILTALQGLVQRADRIVGLVESGKGSIGKLLVDDTLYNRLLDIVASVQQLANVLNSDKGTLGKLIYDPQLYDQVRGELTRLDDIMQGLQQGQGTAGKLLKDPKLYDDFHKSVSEINTLLADLNAGKGTAGKLLKSDELSNQIQATLGKLDLIIDKVNSGQGTIGQLLVNTSLYDNLNGTTREMHELMKDFRANPKKFLRIKLGLF
jgi:phospholipid/cholesterol/gamma-HCH transport system substrate-binding protein